MKKDSIKQWMNVKFPGVVNKLKKMRNIYNRSRKKVILGDPYSDPASSKMGGDRGTPIDRYYITKFLEEYSSRINNPNVTLEIADDEYSKRYFPHSEHRILTYDSSETRQSVMVGDLTDCNTLKAESIDCFICTQTLNFIYDVKSAIAGIRFILKENGVALVTVSGLSQLSPYDYPRWGDYWRFTDMSIKQLFKEYFDDVTVESYGNLSTLLAFLQGMSVEDIRGGIDMDKKDPMFPITIGVVVKK